MSTEEYSWHAIAVGNRLFGPYNFIVLKAPPDWRIVIMPMASEVFRHREVNGVKWVRDGEVMHFIKDGSESYVLRVKIRPGRRLRGGSSLYVNGHPGVYEVRQGRDGRLTLRLQFYCNQTDRTIALELEGLRDLSPLGFLAGSQCH